MPRDFYPRREADIVAWTANFSAKISIAAGSYGLTPAQAESYALRQAAFAAAHQTANNPSTNSRSATVAKEDARIALEAETRMLAGIVRATPGVTAEMRVTLGLCPRNGGGRSPRLPRPDHPPVVRIVSVIGRTVTLRLADADSSTSGRKPRGVRGAQIFSFAGEHPPADLTEWHFPLGTNRNTAEIRFNDPSLAPGAKVWLTARWSNPRGQAGPASAPVHTHLSYAVTLPANRMAA